jgi:hypothetical protein
VWFEANAFRITRSGTDFYASIAGLEVLSSSGWVHDETPSGAINGSNATFTTAFEFLPATVEVYLNGIRQRLVDDFTLSGGDTIQFTNSPMTGEQITVNYEKA